jgi:hypothetical protein
MWNAAITGGGLIPIDSDYFGLDDGLTRALYLFGMKLRGGMHVASVTMRRLRELIGDNRGMQGQIRRLIARGNILDCRLEIHPFPGFRTADNVVFSGMEICRTVDG